MSRERGYKSYWRVLFALPAVLVLALYCTTGLGAPETPAETDDRDTAILAELEELRLAPDSEFDFTRAAALVSEFAYEDTDADAICAELEKMVAEARPYLDAQPDIERKIQALNTYLFRRKKFLYKIHVKALGEVLETTTGDCVGLTTLYLAIGLKLGLELFPVDLPGHVNCRYEKDDFARNIDPAWNGIEVPDEYWLQEYALTSEQAKKLRYLINVSLKDFIGLIFANLNYLDTLGEVIERDPGTYTEIGFKWAPNHPIVKVKKAFILSTQGMGTEAIELLDEILAIYPGYETALGAKGFLYYRAARWRDAITAYEKWQNRLYDNPTANYSAHWRTLSECYGLLERDDDAGAAQAKMWLWWAREAKRDDEPAHTVIERLLKAVEIDDSLLEAWSDLCIEYEEAGMLAELEKSIKKVEALGSDDYIRFYILGLYYYNRAKYPEAVEQLTIAVERDPSRLKGIHMRACAYYSQGEYTKARDDLIKVVESRFNEWPHYIQIADTYALKPDATEEDYRKAIAVCREAISKYPEYTEPYFYAAKLLRFEFSEDEEAVKLLDEAIRIDPFYIEALAERGWAFKDLGERVKALADFERIVEIEPNWAFIYRETIKELKGEAGEENASGESE